MIKAKVKKNKIGLAFREAEFPFIFGFGVNDVEASVGWLAEVDHLDEIKLKSSEVKKYLTEIEELATTEYREEAANLALAVKKVWREVEITFLPTRRKYP